MGQLTLTAPDKTPPLRPAGLVFTAVSATSASLGWEPATDPQVAGEVSSGIVGYKVYRSYVNGSLITTKGTSYSDNNLNNSVIYSYAVTAVDGAGNESAMSDTITIPAGRDAGALYIYYFKATPASVSPNQPVTLSWYATGGAAMGIDNGVGNVTGAASIVVYPGQSTTYTLTNTNASGISMRASVTIKVNAPISSGLITACGQITQGGVYQLAQDLMASSDVPCLDVHDAPNVQINCNQHSIGGGGSANFPTYVSFTNAPNFSLSSCGFQSFVRSGAIANYKAVAVNGGSAGTISNNRMDHDGSIEAHNAQGLQVLNNSINGNIAVYDSSGVTVANNTIGFRDAAEAGYFILFHNVSGSSIQGNQLNGNAKAASIPATDDGIVAEYVTNVTIDGNTIANFWDSGIETLGVVENSRFTHNVIRNTRISAIGGWYGRNSWRGNTVDGNTADGSAPLFVFGVTDNPRFLAPADMTRPVYFENNRFTNNRLIFEATGGPYAIVSKFSITGGYPFLDPQPTLIIDNNLFVNNDFGNGAVVVSPSSLALDGGGNVCNSSALTPDFPLRCARNFKPSISAFVASPASITAGGSTFLLWAINGDNTTVSIDHNALSPTAPASLSGGGYVTVTPNSTTTYTLTAANPFGSVTSTVTITVGPPTGN